ncbi:MAG: putative acyl-CoA thioester hydrolase [Ignavibacteriaceae bacterium]|nr:putative acyl-CoA thioester hydrolase [Ignavibacteriaceae bacterium]MCC7094678.1 acyl-CoA thioesterase [Ignavibacteriaceae bacterium]NUM61765.1 acyl-CoA thioesterase [Ignavibacteriaceae bacterium]
MNVRKVSESQITMTELVLPHHTNQLGTLFGGQLMYWIDMCASLSAEKITGRVCVTASVDKVDFLHPVKLGDAVTLLSSVNRVFNTSLEIGVKVFAQNFKEGTVKHTNSAYLTFVNVDQQGKPVKAIEAVPETNEQKRRFNEALIRRENRLKSRSVEK